MGQGKSKTPITDALDTKFFRPISDIIGTYTFSCCQDCEIDETKFLRHLTSRQIHYFSNIDTRINHQSPYANLFNEWYPNCTSSFVIYSNIRIDQFPTLDNVCNISAKIHEQDLFEHFQNVDICLDINVLVKRLTIAKNHGQLNQVNYEDFLYFVLGKIMS